MQRQQKHGKRPPHHSGAWFGRCAALYEAPSEADQGKKGEPPDRCNPAVVTGTRIERRQDPQSVDRILRSLPAWFGIQEAIRVYVDSAARLPSYLATVGGEVVGVALVERHFPDSAEIHLIAVDPIHHGSGVGSALVRVIEDDLRADGARMLQVHTVGPSFDNQEYAKTRQFCVAAGFIPLREVDGLDRDGPTLILVKSLETCGATRG
jgi:GNAT superfamily N-acetyltransferase